jgi:nucleotide-binding universal stress UspA family protein
MYRRILIGYDGGDQSRDAITLGQKLAEQTGAELVVAGVFQFDPVWGGFDSRFHEAEADWKRQIDAAAESAGAAAKSISSSSAARGLHDLAVQSEADLILVGSASHGRVGQTLAGSTGVALLHGSPCASASRRTAIATMPRRRSRRSWSPSTARSNPITRSTPPAGSPRSWAPG